ncbi:MAG: hypothetical protein M3O15_01815 [Acidobacteriota bacterium]|nr:hypothetical protein [Acidobacteriota bacterium]
MIKCATCGKEFPDGTAILVCDNCGTAFPASGPAPSVPAVASGPAGTGWTDPEPPLEPPPAPDDSDLDPDKLDVASAYGKRSIISVIGFSESGKSFFVNRLLDLMLERAWDCRPAPKDQIPTSSEGLQISHLVPVNEGRASGRLDHSYLLVDCAGESFQQAFDSQWQDGMLAGTKTRSYLTALGLASAYILVLRAEDLLVTAEGDGPPSPGRPSGDYLNRMLNTFYQILDGIIVAKERLRSQSPEEFLRQGISKQELDAAALRTRRHFRQPLAIVFSLADRLEDLPGADDAYDLDPYLFALPRAGKLFKAVTKTFDYHRFDFLSSFYQHDAKGPADKTRVNYRLPSYGAAEIFDWVRELIHPTIPVLGTTLRMARGRVPTRHAVMLRKLVDGGFRRALRQGRVP